MTSTGNDSQDMPHQLLLKEKIAIQERLDDQKFAQDAMRKVIAEQCSYTKHLTEQIKLEDAVNAKMFDQLGSCEANKRLTRIEEELDRLDRKGCKREDVWQYRRKAGGRSRAAWRGRRG